MRGLGPQQGPFAVVALEREGAQPVDHELEEPAGLVGATDGTELRRLPPHRAVAAQVVERVERRQQQALAEVRDAADRQRLVRHADIEHEPDVGVAPALGEVDGNAADVDPFYVHAHARPPWSPTRPSADRVAHRLPSGSAPADVQRGGAVTAARLPSEVVRRGWRTSWRS